jgi:hypothetical protein
VIFTRVGVAAKAEVGMSQTHRLSWDELERLRRYRQEWSRIATCTEPADRARAEAALVRVYESIGEPPPCFVWVDSPMSAPWSRHSRRRDNLVDEMFFAQSWSSSVWNSFRVALEDPPRDRLGGRLRAWVRQVVGFGWGEAPWRLLRASMASSRWARRLSPRHRGEICDHGPLDLYWGQLGANRLAFYLFCRDELGVRYDPRDSEGLDRETEIARSCLWWWPCRSVCLVSERPAEFHLNLEGSLHNDAGPALRFRDGWSVWAIHGVAVDEQMVLRPESQSLRRIRREPDAEVKRIRIARYGWGRYVNEAGPAAVDAAVLDRRRNDIEATRETLVRGPEGQILLVCTCPSTARVYALEVPRDLRTCAEAQAWLSGGLAGRIINAC